MHALDCPQTHRNPISFQFSQTLRSTFAYVSTTFLEIPHQVTIKFCISTFMSAAVPSSSDMVKPTVSESTRSTSEGPKETENKSNYVPFPWYRNLFYDLLLWILATIVNNFFREVKTRGAFRVPRSGPVIFVAAPHANQFVDGVVLMNQVKREANRRISFLIAAKSYRQKFIGHFSRVQQSIPVVRAQDNLKPGRGKIKIDLDNDRLLVIGTGTKFTEDCSPKGIIALPQSLGASEVVEVRSDTELVIRKEFKDTQQIRTLLTKGTSFKAAHKVDQKEVYERVFEHLSHGNCIGIFPEGGSHDRTDLLPLKAGVAIMALGAMQHDPGCNVTIVPCGMNYFNAHKFRSRAVVEFGHPIEIPRELVKKYSNPSTNRESVKELLEIITTGLKAVTVTCEDYETLMMVQAARRLYAGNFAQYLPIPLVVEMNRRLVLGYQTYKNEKTIQDIREKVIKYNKLLSSLYLPDHHVEECDESNKLRVLPIFLFRIFKMIFLFLLALPGSILFSPVFICSKIVSGRKRATALANSTVKIRGRDVIATWKILIAMGVAPLVYSFYATVGTIYCYFYGILHYKLVSIWFALYMLGVLVTYAALLVGEQGVDLLKSMRPLYLSLTSGSSIRELKIMRKELAEEITNLVNHYGPELFPDDFNLLHIRDKLYANEGYIDSDEEEERKTQELRNRRMRNRKAAKKHKAAATKTMELKSESSSSINDTELSLQDEEVSSISDGISYVNSENSLSNIPLFSDYHLHMNASNPDLQLEAQSNFHSTASMADDYNSRNMDNRPAYSRNNSHLELNFANAKHRREPSDALRTTQKMKLSDKIKNQVRQGRTQGET
ncbi:Glycerol-3-phosphate/dihydroxyacetone phosphate acyltransferase [Meyerozyma guilliermondii]